MKFITMMLTGVICLNVYAADYTNALEPFHSRTTTFENRSTQNVSCTLLARIQGTCPAGEKKVFSTDDGFFYTLPGNPKQYTKFILNNLNNPTKEKTEPLKPHEERPITFLPQQSLSITLGELSYFLGIQNLQGLEAPNNHVSFEQTEQGLRVILGVGETTSHQPILWEIPKSRHNIYKKEIGMLVSLFKDSTSFEEAFHSTPPLQKGNYIPKINHRIWLNPSHEAPIEALQYFVENACYLGKSWQFIFWCLDKEKIPNTIHFLTSNILNIQIKELHTLTNQGWFPKIIFEGLMQDSYFTVASNLARLAVLFAFGGIYSDLGVEIKQDINHLIESYQHIFSSKKTLPILNEGVIGCIKNSPFLWYLFEIYKKLHRVNQEFLTDIDQRNYAGVGLISSEIFPHALFKILSIDLSFIMTYEGPYYQFHSIRTWMDNGKFGNKPTMHHKITSKKLLGYMGIPEQQLNLDQYGVLTSDYSLAQCEFVRLINLHFHGLPFEEVKKRRMYHHQKALSIYLNNTNKKMTIPHVHHRIWLTDPANPHEVPLTLLEYTKKSLEALSNDFITIFWFNAETLLPQTIAWIKTNLPHAQIRNIQEITQTMHGKEIFETLLSMNRFANAGILLRYNILNEIGGIYADMGTLLRYNIQEAIDKFDYIFSQRDFSLSENWLDVNIMASKPHAPLWEKFFIFIEGLKHVKERNTLHSDFDKLKRYMPIRVDHGWFSGHGLSAAIDAFLTEDDALLAMNFNSLFRSCSTESWIGQTKFGSTNCLSTLYRFV